MGDDDSTMLKQTSRRRKDALEEELAEAFKDGWRVESRGEYQVVLVHGRRVNHTLHLLLSFFTGGLWLIIWLLLATTGGEERMLLQVDEYCRISTHEM